MSARATPTTLIAVFILWLSLFLVPMVAFAQEDTTPVTVEVVFPGEEEELGSPEVRMSSVSSSSRTSSLLFQNVAQPRVQTRVEKAAEAERQQAEAEPQLRRPRTVGGFLRYERVDFDHLDTLDLDGNIYSTNVQMIWDVADVSFGFLIPYDYLDLDSLDAHRIGTIVFGQYHLLVNAITTLSFTGNGQYTYTAIDNSDLDDVNTLGAGASMSLTLDGEIFVGGGSFSYQYNEDDSDSDIDHQHLIKLGITAGARLGANAALTVFGTWNYDATDYDETLGNVDEDYFDLGLELAWALSPTWRLTGGYKTILGLEDFVSNQVFLGTLIRF